MAKAYALTLKNLGSTSPIYILIISHYYYQDGQKSHIATYERDVKSHYIYLSIYINENTFFI